MIEYVKKIEEVDQNKLIVTGHSRNGKVAIIIGFMNEDIAIINPANSGITGSAVVKFYGYKSSDLVYLTHKKRFHYWFKESFGKKYSRNEDKLKFDSHFELSLISPRNLLIQIDKKELFDNPIGSQIAYEGALPVYKMMNVKNNISLDFLNKSHAHTSLEIERLIDYANAAFTDQLKDRKFNKLPFSRTDKIKALLYDRFRISKYNIVKTIKKIIY